MGQIIKCCVLSSTVNKCFFRKKIFIKFCPSDSVVVVVLLVKMLSMIIMMKCLDWSFIFSMLPFANWSFFLVIRWHFSLLLWFVQQLNNLPKYFLKIIFRCFCCYCSCLKQHFSTRTLHCHYINHLVNSIKVFDTK